MKASERYYVEAFMENSRTLSRTLSGTYDTSVSSKKPRSSLHGAALATATGQNLQTTIDLLYARRNDSFSPRAVLALTYAVQKTITAAILEDKDALRSHEIPDGRTYGYPVRTLPAELQRFSEWLAGVLDSDSDVHTRCGILEHAFETIHPFADATGRTGRALSAFLSMRHEAPLKKVDDRQAYYGSMEWIAPEKLYSPESHRRFLTYYRALPMIGGAP